MPDSPPPNESLPIPPLSFFESLMRGIPADAWLQFFKDHPTLKGTIFEGFRVPINKLEQLVRQPHIVARLRRVALSDTPIFNDILQMWGQEQLPVLAFMEMLDPDILFETWRDFKDFIGPERFFAGLYLLGYLEDKRFRELIDEGFWGRQMDVHTLEPFVPLRQLWKEFVEQYPQAKGWFDNGPSISKEDLETLPEESRQSLRRQVHRLEDRCTKLQMKLDRAEQEKSQWQEEAFRYRNEHEALRKQLAESERTFSIKLEESLARLRAQWFQRYRTLDAPFIQETADTLDSVLRRTERAFDLQRRADEEYGSVGAVRQKLVQVELYLGEIERIYVDSLVVHSEVSKAKEVLLSAKERLLKLPGVSKILGRDSAPQTAADMRQRIRLLDAVPENLSKITELRALLDRFAILGFIEDPQPILEDIEHKRRQIMEILYAQYQTFQVQPPRERYFRNLEDFVESGESKKYDLYIDGYNVLLRLQGDGRSLPRLGLTMPREQFIAAVVKKSRHFRKVYLVFDGREESRDRQGNTEIIYTDKKRGSTADAHIIQTVHKGKDRKVLLVTEDQEIIRAMEDKLYAVVGPYHFYMFVHDLHFPDIP